MRFSILHLYNAPTGEAVHHIHTEGCQCREVRPENVSFLSLLETKVEAHSAYGIVTSRLMNARPGEVLFGRADYKLMPCCDLSLPAAYKEFKRFNP